MIKLIKTALAVNLTARRYTNMDYAPHTAENVVQNANKLIDVFRSKQWLYCFCSREFL